MTITYEREQVIDFTKPFWNIGITILFRKPKPEPPELFSFLSPLDTQVWIYVIAVYLCVSFMMFVIARFTPYEWCNPHPCDPNTDTVENQFSVLNSLWFTIGAFMQQGTILNNIEPRREEFTTCCFCQKSWAEIHSYHRESNRKMYFKLLCMKVL